MRFEMGVELGERLPKQAEVSLRPAVCALPSITPVGMGALQPGASASFSVVEQGETRRADRRRVPSGPRSAEQIRRLAGSRTLVDLRLEELLSLPAIKAGQEARRC